MNMSMDIELLASVVHDVWANWMKYMLEQGYYNSQNVALFGRVENERRWIMPQGVLSRWTRQMNTPYDELTEKEKESDREIALQYLQLIEEYQADGE